MSQRPTKVERGYVPPTSGKDLYCKTKIQSGRKSEEDSLNFNDFVDSITTKTVYRPLPLRYTLEWPLTPSHNEANAYADWIGARLPTLHEVRSIHEQVEEAKHTTALLANGSMNTPHPGRDRIFVDLISCNFGLQHFHPTPFTQNGARFSGLGDMGRAWSGRARFFSPQPGFKLREVYPGYSAEFMDEKHTALAGGSWAILPRIAGRKTFSNWWQRNYMYSWVIVYLVRDVK